MMARMFVIVTVICLFWQAMAFAGTRVVVATDAAEMHEFMHFAKASHHHEAHSDDVHQDESLESMQHALADCSVFPALTALPEPGGKSESSPPLVPVVPSLVGTVGVGGLDRPPRSLT